MLRRLGRSVTRTIGALTALWSLALSGGPVALHQCPMHSIPTATAAGHEMAGMRDMADMPGMAGMAGMHHAAQSTDTPDAPDSPTQHKNCCCPDGGCTSTPVALVAAAIALPEARVAMGDSGRNEIRVAPRTSRVDLALPYSNGPPTV